ncbi:MAG TPA: phosphatase [Candidatus Eubacterium avistercoris]|uniref:Phosphatase n=1 Tax=Candidatus Eubacterium avistercoris TaxID=2838567 RepID=A0A9D2IFH3_9FIRM|nr:phosphatase [Candidatus Eubacterium avistercoris]
MKYAVIDVGSNTVRLSVYRVENKKFEQLFTVKETVGLAGYIKEKKMSEEGMEQAARTLNRFKRILNQFDIDRVWVFATASLRNIKNSEETVKYILENTGYHIEILSGRDEAMYDFFGVRSQYDITEGLIFDIGGGSTEIITCENREPCVFESVGIGALNLYYDCVSKIIPGKKEIECIQRKIRKELKTLFGCEICLKKFKTEEIIGVGGSIRALLKIVNLYYKKEARNRTITVKELNEILELALEKNKKLQRMILKACPERVHTLIPGMLIAKNIAEKTKCRSIFVSRCGVREGYLYKKMLA